MGKLSANSSLTETLYCLITCSVQRLGVVNKIATFAHFSKVFKEHIKKNQPKCEKNSTQLQLYYIMNLNLRHWSKDQ